MTGIRLSVPPANGTCKLGKKAGAKPKKRNNPVVVVINMRTYPSRSDNEPAERREAFCQRSQ